MYIKFDHCLNTVAIGFIETSAAQALTSHLAIQAGTDSFLCEQAKLKHIKE
jgi:hypothetical protein